jgi:plastocyanin
MRIFVLLVFVLGCLVIGCNQRTSPPPQSGQQQPAATAQVDPAQAASISGTITVQGAISAAQKIDMTFDPACTLNNQPAYSEAYVVDQGKLANVYVYVKEGLPAARYPLPPEPAVLDQNGCRYTPHVLGVMAGQTLLIKNSDMAMHNVHPQPANNDQWNVSQMPKGDPVKQTFSNPELMIPIKCNQHPWMKMYLNVSATPYFAVSNKDGSFVIRGLPPGEYTIAAVHEKMGEKTQHIKIGPKENASLSFSFNTSEAKTAGPRDR